ncbi:MAG: hypothetical protein GY754_46290 [bacterium]|nr:hypothetical protein [bacterium]
MVDEIEMEPGTNDEERIDSLFLLTMIFIMKMNIIRKEEFKKNMGSGKSTKDPGRNDPCPCGSGLKFKKCCLSKLH